MRDKRTKEQKTCDYKETPHQGPNDAVFLWALRGDLPVGYYRTGPGEVIMYKNIKISLIEYIMAIAVN